MIYFEIGILLFVGLSLLVYGFYAVFKTKFFIELNYRLSGSPSHFKSLIEKRWFNINVKLCGTRISHYCRLGDYNPGCLYDNDYLS